MAALRYVIERVILVLSGCMWTLAAGESCGATWGGQYQMGVSGAHDCIAGNCGESIVVYAECQAAALAQGGAVGAEENWGGTKGCHKQGPDWQYNTNMNGAGAQGHTPVCKLSSGGDVGGDPVASYGSRRVEFHTPLHQPTLLFQGADLKVYISTFAGYAADQWIEQVQVEGKSGQKLLDVAIKKNLDVYFEPEVHKFQTINVTLYQPHPIVVPVFPPAHGYWFLEDLTVTFQKPGWSTARNGRTRFPLRECVFVASAASKLVVCSSSAHEHFGQGRGAWKYAHLDMHILGADSENTGAMKGILPELWGYVPLSESTKSLIVRNWTVADSANAPDFFAIDYVSTQAPEQLFAKSSKDNMAFA